MKRILLYIFIVFFSINANAQFANTQTISSKSTLYKVLGGLTSDSAMIISNSYTDTTSANLSVASKYSGSIIRVGTKLYYRTLLPNKWNEILLSTSSGFITPSDTATMLANYTRDSDTAFLVANRLKISDTATMLQRGWLSNRSKDSTAVLRALINSKGGGSVTSVATNTGTGLAGGTITTTGTLRIDTLNVSTRLWRQKGIDSTVGLIVQKVNIIDTAPMLNPYLRKADTTLINGYATKYSVKPYDTTIVHNRPVFIDQFLNNFYGRGMLTAETINLTTEQAIGTNAAAGVDIIRVADTSVFIVGATVTIKHDNGLYYTYFVSSKGGDGVSGTIGLKPSLQYAVSTSSKIERTWFNKAHAGKFYMRQLAQQIAKATEISSAIPTGNRILYTNFSDTPSLSKDTLTVVGSSVITYYGASNSGVDTASPIRFPLGNTAYVEISAANSGAETPLFYIDRPTQMVASVAMVMNSNVNSYAIQIINDSGRLVATYKIPTSQSKNVSKLYKFPFFSSYSNKIKVRIISDTFTAAAAVSISQIDVFEQSTASKDAITKKKSVIVGLGDSWMQGDTAITLQREPITKQLGIELPYATIINSGVGGNTIRNMLDRFDTDVTPYKPDYVILETGTNDCYNPASSTFYPNAVNDWIDVYNQLIHKVLSIGAKPIIVGVPALAQTDADVPSFPQWLLNDRARIYAQKFYRFLSKQTSQGGDYEWKVNVSDTSNMLNNYQRKTTLIPTSQGGTGRSTWTTGTIPVIGSGTGKPFTDLNNSFFFDSTYKSLMIGGNSRFYRGHLNIGTFDVPKISLSQTAGYRWTTYIDSIVGNLRFRYEEGSIEPLIIDRLGAITALSLAGSGDRMVVAESDGKLKTQAIVTTTSGTYTPALTNVTNTSARTAYTCTYTRIGDIVTVYFKVDVTPTAANTNTELDIEVPTDGGSSLTYGVFSSANSDLVNGHVYDGGSNIGRIKFYSKGTSSITLIGSFSYQYVD